MVDNSLDVVSEVLNAGTDTVQSSITYTLTSDVENLALIGIAALNGIGNALNNVLTGNAGTNTLTGGLGNDTYVVDSSLDSVVEAVGEGTDIVQSSASYALSGNIETLALTGTGNTNATGNDLNNTLTGNSGNNVLDGGLGNDAMSGGLGDDTYSVDSVSDSVTEAAGAGTDTVLAGITYTLGVNVENLALTGSNAINGTGNTGDNVLTGNSANNTLSGGTGVDTLVGGAGNDTYVVDNSLDSIVEAVGEGTDLVQSSVAYTLAANVENLALTGATAIDGTGNALDNILTGNTGVNTLTGNAGNDTLIGGTGSDTLIGGIGDDNYTVDNTLDIVTELLAEGIDTVQSSVTYTLTDNIENLTLTGATALNGTGNVLDNIITGNTGANILDGSSGNDTVSYLLGANAAVLASLALTTAQATGGSGSDTLLNFENITGSTFNDTLTGNTVANILDGGLGVDILTGGDGSDTYIVDNTGDVVSETNANATAGGTDLVQSYISYDLTDTDGAGVNGGNVEQLRLMGGSNINAMGNSLNNTVFTNVGDNTIDGGTGTDTVSYQFGASAAVTVNLAFTVSQATGGSGNDTLVNIENLIGSNFNDSLTGNSANNSFNGGLGADTMTGGLGNETMKESKKLACPLTASGIFLKNGQRLKHLSG